MDDVNALKEEFKYLINNKLPATYIKPVQLNHCFNRIILDWLYKDCWYNHLPKNKTALHQLNAKQIRLMIERMQHWLLDKNLLITDNLHSLTYRNKLKH